MSKSGSPGQQAKRLWLIVKASPPVLALILASYAWIVRETPAAARAHWLTQHGYSEVLLEDNKAGTFDITASGNGKPLRLLIDTGGGHGFLDDEVTKRLGLKPEPLKQGGTNRFKDEGKVPTKVIVEDFVIGNLHTRWPAMVLHISKRAPRDGGLGCSYLERFGAVIDYGAKKMFLRSRTPDFARGKDSFTALLKREGYQEVPLSSPKKSKTFQVTATIEGEPVHLEIDTGSTTSVMSRSLADRLHLPVYGEAKANTFLGITPARKIHAKALSIAGHAEALDALVMDWDRYDPSIDGLLGSRFLVAHAAVIDCASRKLYLQVH